MKLSTLLRAYTLALAEIAMVENAVAIAPFSKKVPELYAMRDRKIRLFNTLEVEINRRVAKIEAVQQ